MRGHVRAFPMRQTAPVLVVGLKTQRPFHFNPCLTYILLLDHQRLSAMPRAIRCSIKELFTFVLLFIAAVFLDDHRRAPRAEELQLLRNVNCG